MVVRVRDPLQRYRQERTLVAVVLAGHGGGQIQAQVVRPSRTRGGCLCPRQLRQGLGVGQQLWIKVFALRLQARLRQQVARAQAVLGHIKLKVFGTGGLYARQRRQVLRPSLGGGKTRQQTRGLLLRPELARNRQ